MQVEEEKITLAKKRDIDRKIEITKGQIRESMSGFNSVPTTNESVIRLLTNLIPDVYILDVFQKIGYEMEVEAKSPPFNSTFDKIDNFKLSLYETPINYAASNFTGIGSFLCKDEFRKIYEILKNDRDLIEDYKDCIGKIIVAIEGTTGDYNRRADIYKSNSLDFFRGLIPDRYMSGGMFGITRSRVISKTRGVSSEDEYGQRITERRGPKYTRIGRLEKQEEARKKWIERVKDRKYESFPLLLSSYLLILLDPLLPIVTGKQIQ